MCGPCVSIKNESVVAYSSGTPAIWFQRYIVLAGRSGSFGLVAVSKPRDTVFESRGCDKHRSKLFKSLECRICL